VSDPTHWRYCADNSPPTTTGLFESFPTTEPPPPSALPLPAEVPPKHEATRRDAAREQREQDADSEFSLAVLLPQVQEGFAEDRAQEVPKDF